MHFPKELLMEAQSGKDDASNKIYSHIKINIINQRIILGKMKMKIQMIVVSQLHYIIQAVKIQCNLHSKFCAKHLKFLSSLVKASLYQKAVFTILPAC